MAVAVLRTGPSLLRVGPVACCALIGALVVTLGCEVDRVPFNRLVEGKRFLAAGMPFKAADLFAESLTREKGTIPEARAHLAVAYDQAMRKVYDIPSERAKYQQKAAAELALIADDPTAIAHLVGILEYHSLSSQSAESLLVDLGPAAVDALLVSFAMKPNERETIVGVLGEIGAPSVQGIERAIDSRKLNATEEAALVRVLGSMPGADTERILTNFRDNMALAEGVRMEASTSLYRLGDKHDRARLLAALDSQDTLVRRAAAYSMTFLNEAPDPNMLAKHLDDEDAAVRLNIVRALGEHRSDPKVARNLISTLRVDPNSDVANAAGNSLSRYGPDVIDRVLDALGSEEKWPRRQRLVRVLKSDDIRHGFTQQQEFRLYEHFDKREENPDVKRDLAQLLKDMESDENPTE